MNRRRTINERHKSVLIAFGAEDIAVLSAAIEPFPPSAATYLDKGSKMHWWPDLKGGVRSGEL